MRDSTLLAMIILYYNRHHFSWYSMKKYIGYLPFVREKLFKTYITLQQSVQIPNYSRFKALPIYGLTEDDVMSRLDKIENKDNQNQNTKISGIIYCDDKLHREKMMRLFSRYALSNPLHPDIFPEIRAMEIDIVSMVSHMFDGTKETCGNVTTGGTESILLACYTYREYCRKEHGITSPNMVAFTSVHPAFDKACHYFGISLIKATTWNKMKWRINRNTICVIGSAPTYAYGIVDPIREMAEYCEKKGKAFHVDCCMGGFLIPFLKNNPVTFKNRGITSISADTHKYGNCLKGSSVLLFAHSSIKKHQHFVKTDWEGGMYATPTLLGSKSGAIIASTWGSLMYTGSKKYSMIAENIQKNVRRIVDIFGNGKNKDIQIIGNPDVNIVAFSSNSLDIYRIVDEMKNLGWDLSVLTNPAAFHFCITSVHSDIIITRFIVDFQLSIGKVINDPAKELSGTLAIYGSSAKIENSIFTEDVVNEYVGLLSNENIVI
jgi:sphinganine-1-phosphate aldolase